jgi:hypothetical protein
MFAGWTAVAMARPQLLPLDVRGEPNRVHVLDATITGADKTAFPPVPAQLDGAQRAFLEKYQPLSDAALTKVAPVSHTSFSAAGFCFSEFPCLSVAHVAVATVGDKEEVEREQVAAILDRLTASPNTTFGAVPGKLFTGLRVAEKGAILDVIAAPGTMESNVLGGLVFDMFKLQSDDVSTNAIRAAPAPTDGHAADPLALCLYPEGADAQRAFNFCTGKELDGSAGPSGKPGRAKRGLISDLFSGALENFQMVKCTILDCN